MFPLIGKDTKLCAVMGVNASASYALQTFNNVFKTGAYDIAAISLNISEEHYPITMKSISASKLDKTYLEEEYKQSALSYCDEIDGVSKICGFVDLIEVAQEKSYGINLYAQALLSILSLYKLDTKRVALIAGTHETKAALVALNEMDVASVHLYDTSLEEGAKTAQEISEYLSFSVEVDILTRNATLDAKAYDLIINTSTKGRYKNKKEFEVINADECVFIDRFNTEDTLGGNIAFKQYISGKELTSTLVMLSTKKWFDAPETISPHIIQNIAFN